MNTVLKFYNKYRETGYSLFNPPLPTPFNFLSLGAGVQSSALALMAAQGEVTPMPDAAIFADTHAEPANVYHWLDWLEKQLPFPVLRVSNGSLTKESLRIRTSAKSGEPYISHLIPAYTLNANQSKGTYLRQCTNTHKITPIKREVNKLRGKYPATVWIGISYDEIQRMKESVQKNVQHRWPLIERKITREKCIEWMTTKGFSTPPRSACTYCPYHSDQEWLRMREQDQKSWTDAISYEKQLQSVVAQIPRLTSVPYLHPQREPLEKVIFTNYDKNKEQQFNTMQNECTGMCGV